MLLFVIEASSLRKLMANTTILRHINRYTSEDLVYNNTKRPNFRAVVMLPNRIVVSSN